MRVFDGSGVDERDRPFITGERTPEGFFRVAPGMGLDYAIARGLAYAPYADLLWWETSEPDLAEAEHFAEAIHRVLHRPFSINGLRPKC
jgi:isocitrate lyase